LSLVTCHSLGFRLGLAQTRDAVAIFPLAAFLEEFGALKTLENIALAPKVDAARRLRCCDINDFWLKFNRFQRKADADFNTIQSNANG